MLGQREMTTCTSLSVIVSHLQKPVTEEVLHQVFDAYGAGNKITVVQRDTHVWAFVEFRSWQEAAYARNTLQGRCIFDFCCYLDIQHAWPTVIPATSTSWASSRASPPTATTTSLVMPYRASLQPAAMLSPPSVVLDDRFAATTALRMPPTAPLATPTECLMAGYSHGASMSVAAFTPVNARASLSDISTAISLNSKTHTTYLLPCQDHIEAAHQVLDKMLDVSNKEGEANATLQVFSKDMLHDGQPKHDVDTLAKEDHDAVLTHVGGISLFLELSLDSVNEILGSTDDLCDAVLLEDLSWSDEVLTHVGGLSLFLEFDHDLSIAYGNQLLHRNPLWKYHALYQWSNMREGIHFFLVNVPPNAFRSGHNGMPTSYLVLNKWLPWSRNGFSPGLGDCLVYLFPLVCTQPFGNFIVDATVPRKQWESEHCRCIKKVVNSVLWPMRICWYVHVPSLALICWCQMGITLSCTNSNPEVKVCTSVAIGPGTSVYVQLTEEPTYFQSQPANCLVFSWVCHCWPLESSSKEKNDMSWRLQVQEEPCKCRNICRLFSMSSELENKQWDPGIGQKDLECFLKKDQQILTARFRICSEYLYAAFRQCRPH